MNNFVAIGLRKELVERVRIIVKKGIGYRSIADFVSEAVRIRLEQLEPFLNNMATKGETK